MTTNQINAEKLTELRALSVWELAELAECGKPDTVTSPGADLLTTTRDAFLDDVESGDSTTDWERVIEEHADSAPNVYTHPMWKQFVDLTAYQEDVSDNDTVNLSQLATIALYQIAERLLRKLADELELL